MTLFESEGNQSICRKIKPKLIDNLQKGRTNQMEKEKSLRGEKVIRLIVVCCKKKRIWPDVETDTS